MRFVWKVKMIDSSFGVRTSHWIASPDKAPHLRRIHSHTRHHKQSWSRHKCRPRDLSSERRRTLLFSKHRNYGWWCQTQQLEMCILSPIVSYWTWSSHQKHRLCRDSWRLCAYIDLIVSHLKCIAYWSRSFIRHSVSSGQLHYLLRNSGRRWGSSDCCKRSESWILWALASISDEVCAGAQRRTRAVFAFFEHSLEGHARVYPSAYSLEFHLLAMRWKVQDHRHLHPEPLIPRLCLAIFWICRVFCSSSFTRQICTTIPYRFLDHQITSYSSRYYSILANCLVISAMTPITSAIWWMQLCSWHLGWTSMISNYSSTYPSLITLSATSN